MQYKLFIDKRLLTVNDSMELDSGQTVASLEFEKDGRKYEFEIRVCGEVRVTFKKETYFRPSEFPDALKALFHNGRADGDRRVYIGNNNWFELYVIADGRIDGEWCDVLDGGWTSETDVFSFFLDCAKEFIKQKQN